MNHQIVSKTLRAVVVALILSVIAIQTQAAPSQTYVPVTSAKEMKKVKPGTLVGIQCAECGATTFVTTGKDGSLPGTYYCPHCKTKFVSKTIGNATVGFYEYTDAEGHKAKVLRPM